MKSKNREEFENVQQIFFHFLLFSFDLKLKNKTEEGKIKKSILLFKIWMSLEKDENKTFEMKNK